MPRFEKIYLQRNVDLNCFFANVNHLLNSLYYSITNIHCNWSSDLVEFCFESVYCALCMKWRPFFLNKTLAKLNKNVLKRCIVIIREMNVHHKISVLNNKRLQFSVKFFLHIHVAKMFNMLRPWLTLQSTLAHSLSFSLFRLLCCYVSLLNIDWKTVCNIE